MLRTTSCLRHAQEIWLVPLCRKLTPRSHPYKCRVSETQHMHHQKAAHVCDHCWQASMCPTPIQPYAILSFRPGAVHSTLSIMHFTAVGRELMCCNMVCQLKPLCSPCNICIDAVQ